MYSVLWPLCPHQPVARVAVSISISIPARGADLIVVPDLVTAYPTALPAPAPAPTGEFERDRCATRSHAIDDTCASHAKIACANRHDVRVAATARSGSGLANATGGAVLRE
jgi:hypothetical protein